MLTWALDEESSTSSETGITLLHSEFLEDFQSNCAMTIPDRDFATINWCESQSPGG